MTDMMRFYTFLITNIATMPTLIIMLYQLTKKYRQSRDPGTGKADPIRLLMLLQIAFWFESIVYSTLFRLITFEEPGNIFESINIASLAISFMITTGVTLLSYVHHKESWMYAAWFFYGGLLLYGILTGVAFTFFGWENLIIIGEIIPGNMNTFYALQFGFMTVGEAAVDLFFFITGVKYKDDKIFGLGIFFLLPMISGATSSNIFIYVICYGFIAIYGIPFAMGKIKFFKQKPVQLVEAEVRA